MHPLYLSFNIDALNRMVEQTVKPDRQIFIENPYVLWQRCKQNKGKVDDAALQTELVKAFKDAGKNLAKLFAAMLNMPILNATEFEQLYKLRQSIESNTMKVLAEQKLLQEQQKQLQRRRSRMQSAQKVEDANKNYTKTVHRKRWVLKKSEYHGTACGVKDCHSNCHVPCKLKRTMDSEHLKMCSAFKLKSKTATLHSETDRKELLHHMKDTACPFLVDNDDLNGDGVAYQSVLTNANAFQFQNHHVMAGAFVKIHAASESGWATESHVTDLPLPADIRLCDKFDQDICKVCGHHRRYHFHRNKIWCEEEYSKEVVDEETKQKHDVALRRKERNKRHVKELENKIELSGKRQKTLGADLLTNIQQFEQHGLGGNNTMFVQEHRDLLQGIGSTC